MFIKYLTMLFNKITEWIIITNIKKVEATWFFNINSFPFKTKMYMDITQSINQSLSVGIDNSFEDIKTRAIIVSVDKWNHRSKCLILQTFL